MPLTSEQKEFFDKNGYLVLSQLIKEGLEPCRKRIGEIMSGAEGVHQYVRFGAEGKPVFYRIPQLASQDETFRKVANTPAVAEAVRDLIGPAEVFRDILIAKPPKKGHHVVYHQDAAYWDVDPHKVLSCWMALDDAPAEAGCLQFIPGSHKAPVRHEIFFRGRKLPDWVSRLLRRSVSLTGTGDNPVTVSQKLFGRMKDLILGSASQLFPSISDLNWLTANPKTIPGAAEVSAPCWAGDVIIFHGLLLHASGPNTSPNPRRAYIVTYAASR